jgi:hypothetical protein
MKIALLQRIFALLTTDSILSDNVIEYTDPPSFTDLPDNGLVTKNMIETQYPVPGAQVVTAIEAGVTANPITVAYGTMINPTLIFRNSDGSNYSGAVNNVDTGAGITLTGDDDGAGHFADSFSFIIKP